MSKTQRIIFFVISLMRNPHWHCTLHGTRFTFHAHPTPPVALGPPSIGWPTWNMFYICRITIKAGPGRESFEPPARQMGIVYFNNLDELCLRIGKDVFVIAAGASKQSFTGHHAEYGEVVFYSRPTKVYS